MTITTPYLGGYRSPSAGSDLINRYPPTAQPVAANAVGPSTGIAPVAAVQPSFDADAVSKNILSFIQQRLSNAVEQGASQDQLATLLAQAREGVISGVKQALSQLKDSGALTDTLSSGIGSALQKVDSGLDDLAKQLGLTAGADTASAS